MSTISGSSATVVRSVLSALYAGITTAMRLLLIIGGRASQTATPAWRQSHPQPLSTGERTNVSPAHFSRKDRPRQTLQRNAPNHPETATRPYPADCSVLPPIPDGRDLSPARPFADGPPETAAAAKDSRRPIRRIGCNASDAFTFDLAFIINHEVRPTCEKKIPCHHGWHSPAAH